MNTFKKKNLYIHHPIVHFAEYIVEIVFYNIFTSFCNIYYITLHIELLIK